MQDAGLAGFWKRYRLPLIVAVIGVLAVAWLALSKGMAVKQAEDAAAAERAALLNQVAAERTGMARQLLTSFSLPLAWAVRREMMAGNLDQVDQYVTELVRQPGFEQVVVAQPDGKIVVASDRKNQGKAFASLYDKRYLAADRISLQETAPGKWLVVVPILGLNARLGTVAIAYRLPQPASGQP
jgi:hypothetical protein